MGENITISPVGISHGDLSIEVQNQKQPQSNNNANPNAGGQGGKKKEESLTVLKNGTSVSELVKALNALGVKPKDLTAIFQTLRRVGALQADLEIM